MLRFAALLLAALIAPVAADAAVPDYDTKAVADTARPADFRKLDADRKPADVLAFSGVKPGETVAEYLPGGGYYTRLLSDVVGPTGKVYALETTTWGDENVAGTKKAIAGLSNVTLDTAPLGDFHLPQKVDLFWTTLNYHDLHIPKYAKVDMAAFNKHVFELAEAGRRLSHHRSRGRQGHGRHAVAETAPHRGSDRRPGSNGGGLQTRGRKRCAAQSGRRPHEGGVRSVDPVEDGSVHPDVPQAVVG